MNELTDSIGFPHPTIDMSRDEQNTDNKASQHKLHKMISSKNSQEMKSGEFRVGNLSGFLGENSQSQS